jgi:chitin synthase
MHQFGFAFPTSLASMGTVCLIMTLCAIRNKNVCVFHKIVPDYLFIAEFLYKSWSDFLSDWYVWCWPIWLMSQIWITMHLWTTENERLAQTERIFSTITYDSLMIDQCLALNRRTQNDKTDEDDEQIYEDAKFSVRS